MADIGARASLRDITGYQWLVLLVAWAGWSLDITDFTLYGLVLRQALTELIGGTPTMAQIGKVGGLLTTIGLLGWGLPSDSRPLTAGRGSSGTDQPLMAALETKTDAG